MSKRDDIVLLEDIIESIEKISRYTNQLQLPFFLTDEKTQDAVARNFEIMGEAVSGMSVDFKTQYSHISWQLLKDFRNILIHAYEIIDYALV
ncbi:MAG: HepT-like ribonuclease domain-containing protein [Bacteroidota bacterium]